MNQSKGPSNSNAYYFQTLLKAEFDRYLQEENNKPSLRKFAKKIGLNSGNLSHIMRNQRGLKLQKAEQIIQKLELTYEQKLLFLKSISEFELRKTNSRKTEVLLLVKVGSKNAETIKQKIEELKREISQNVEEDPEDGRWVRIEMEALNFES